jgi:hypothetical protein
MQATALIKYNAFSSRLLLVCCLKGLIILLVFELINTQDYNLLRIHLVGNLLPDKLLRRKLAACQANVTVAGGVGVTHKKVSHIIRCLFAFVFKARLL